MPHVKNVNILSQEIVEVGTGTRKFNVKVTATIKFSETERNIGLNYNVTIALYEIDDTMDVYTVFPNDHQLFLQRASRGDKDDFLGFSNVKSIRSQSNEVEIEHNFPVRASMEPDEEMELKALVVCVPETATAMQWSSTRKIKVVYG